MRSARVLLARVHRRAHAPRRRRIPGHYRLREEAGYIFYLLKLQISLTSRHPMIRRGFRKRLRAGLKKSPPGGIVTQITSAAPLAPRVPTYIAALDANARLGLRARARTRLRRLWWGSLRRGELPASAGVGRGSAARAAARVAHPAAAPARSARSLVTQRELSRARARAAAPLRAGSSTTAGASCMVRRRRRGDVERRYRCRWAGESSQPVQVAKMNVFEITKQPRRPGRAQRIGGVLLV
jgi:hypothetical protein